MPHKTSLDIQRLSHDKVFKQAMRHLHIARDFFDSHLPAFIKQRIDLNTLKHCSTEYDHQHAVKLKASAVDLLFSVDVIGQSQHRTDGFIQLHCEAQSEPQFLMPWRMVSYMHAITEFYLQQHLKTKQLPVIIPLVLYNGKVKYPYATELLPLYGDNADLVRAFMSYRFQLIDLTQLPDDEISQHKKAALLEVVMKHIRDKSFVQLLTQIKQLLAVLDQAKEHDYVLIMLKYLLGCGEAEKVEPMLAALSEYLNPMLRSEIMTIAQRLEQRGIEKGKQEGIQEGIEKGIEKGIERGIEKGIRLEKQALAHRLMQKGLPLQTIAEVTELPLSLLEGMVAHDA